MCPGLGKEEKERIGQVADCFEEPEQHDEGDGSGQHGCETGPEVGLPTGEKSVLHPGTLGGFRGRLKYECGVRSAECGMRNQGRMSNDEAQMKFE